MIAVLAVGVIILGSLPLIVLLGWLVRRGPNCPGEHVTLKRLSPSVHEWRCTKCGDNGVIDDAGLDGGSLLHSC